MLTALVLTKQVCESVIFGCQNISPGELPTFSIDEPQHYCNKTALMAVLP